MCTGCGNPYPTGAKLGTVNGGWGHAACAKVRREAERIRSGETYRAGRKSEWRRGSSPGSARGRF